MEQTGTRVTIRAANPRKFLEDHIAPLVYWRTWPSRGEHKIFNMEEEFWSESQKLPFASVCLNGFRLFDWFPRSPGVYWSEFGISQRQQIREYAYQIDDSHLGLILEPGPKHDLVDLGGIGTIRLLPRRIDDTDCWLATAVHGINCSGGVPLALPQKIMSTANIEWGDTVRLYGQVRFIHEIGATELASAVHHAMPLLVMVDRIERLPEQQQLTTPTVAAPVVLLSGIELLINTTRFPWLRGKWRTTTDLRTSQQIQLGLPPLPPRIDFGYAFAQIPANIQTYDEIEEWFDAYAERFGGQIVTNFDQCRPLLAGAPLSYQRLVSKTYDLAIVENLNFYGAKLAERINHVEQVMSVNVRLGNGTVVHGDLVVANSIKDSFNRIQESVANVELKDALQHLTSRVGELLAHLDSDNARNAAEALETLTKEAARPKPRREWWQLSLKGLQEAASAVKDIGKPVIEAVKMVAQFLAAIS